MKRRRVAVAVTFSLVATTTLMLAPAPDAEGHACRPARVAVRAMGGTKSEAALAEKIAWRESRCTLRARNFSTRTQDDSWGPFQINYYGKLRSTRTKLLGPPATNIQSWERASRNFLKFLRKYGACHWKAPNYCS